MTRPGLLGGLALLATLTLPLTAHAAGSKLSLDLSVGIASNDNFLEYSDSRRKDFRNGVKPYRFAVESMDDLLFDPGAALEWYQEGAKGRSRTLRASWSGDFHARNALADRNAESASWIERFPRGQRLTVGYSRMNHYYVRELSDEDLKRDGVPRELSYRRAEFDQDAYSASWRQPVQRDLDAVLSLRHQVREYSQPFVERSSTAEQAGLTLDWSGLPRRGSFELSGIWRDLRADANDADPVLDDDVSYRAALGSATYRRELLRSGGWRWNGDARFEIERRTYTSDRPTDTSNPDADEYHVGRHDQMLALELGLKVTRGDFAARAYARAEDNAATLGPAAPQGSAPGADAGDYHFSEFGLALDWSLTLLDSRPKRGK